MYAYTSSCMQNKCTDILWCGFKYTWCKKKMHLQASVHRHTNAWQEMWMYAHTNLQMHTYTTALNVASKKHAVAIVLAVNVQMQAHTETVNWIYRHWQWAAEQCGGHYRGESRYWRNLICWRRRRVPREECKKRSRRRKRRVAGGGIGTVAPAGQKQKGWMEAQDVRKKEQR